MNAKTVCLIVCVITTITGIAQPNFQNVTPPTPEVASFAKNIDIPMSYTSGTPQIGIPIYTVKSGSIEVPLSLSYNASGIRVEEAATWVGLGWNLSTGPTLTRSVRGLPDESTYGYKNSASNRKVKYINALPHLSTERQYIETQEMPYKQVDLEPDVYTFSALGYSGQFYWNQDSDRYVFSPYQNVILENGAFNVLILPNGVKCVFGGSSECNCEESLQSTTTTSVNEGISYAPTTDSDPYVTSWGITEIAEPAGRSVKFYYDMDYSVKEFGRGTESKGATLDNPGNEYRTSFYVQSFNKPILRQISGDNCRIEFIRHSSIREDVYNEGKSLDTIMIKNKAGQELKSFLFSYDYFTSADSILLPGLDNYVGVARRRLTLRNVREKNIDSSMAMPPYEFTYNDVELPNRLSTSQDYWGYYNGKNNNRLMPRFVDAINGADRRIDPAYTQAGMLKSIQYPTGGNTRYSFEPNNAITNMFLANPNANPNSIIFNVNTYLERPDIIDKSYTFFPLATPDPPYVTYYMDTFRVTLPGSLVKVAPNLPYPCAADNNGLCLYTLKIKSLPDSAISITITNNSIQYLELPNSLYKMEMLYSGSGQPGLCTAQLTWQEKPDSANVLMGGVRVNKITSNDNAGNVISRSFDYHMGDSSIYSSGIPAGLPTHVLWEYDTLGNPLRFGYVSSSATPLTSDGQTVKYMFVTEYSDSLKLSFKTEYNFLCDFSEITFGEPHPNAPPLQKNWLNNRLIAKKTYQKTPSGYKLLTHDENTYGSFKTLEHIYGLHGLGMQPYYVATEWHVPTGSSSTVYSYDSSPATSIVTSSENSYNDDFLVAKTTTTNSKGDVVASKTWYPNDYNNVSGYNLEYLKDKNIIAVPIKQEVCINGKIRSGSIVKYNTNGSPTNVYAYEKATLEDTVSHNRNTILESNYQLKTTASYDIDNILKQVNSSNAPISSYIWDYGISGFDGSLTNIQPTAAIQNADSTSVAFTSFESNGSTGSWNFTWPASSDVTAPTGTRCYDLSGGNITKSTLSSGTTYIVSYWSKNGSYTLTGSNTPKTGKTIDGWTYYEHEVTGATSLTISGAGYIDELRLYPKGALMTTYAYKLGVGISSQCDANNRITYYEYDGLGRLRRIKDQDKNIVKVSDYQYQSSSQQ